MLNKITLAVLTTAVLIGVGGIAAPPASADTKPCISKAEYRAVKNGMTLTKVASIVGSKGRVSMSMTSLGLVMRDYKVCGSRYSVSSVTYTNGRVSDKLFVSLG